MKKLICVVTAMFIALVPTMVEAWGEEGHAVVGALAESMLSASAKAQVHSLLAAGETLASVSIWADNVKFSTRKDSYFWHFVDIPRNVTTFDDARDCFLPTHGGPNQATDHMNCVVDRIAYFKQVLADTSQQPSDRTDALKFLVHFVGDIHQPFHAMGDATGGNDNHITLFGTTTCEGNKPCNLHHAWDTDLITHTGMDANAYVQHLQGFITANHIVPSGDPTAWANESHAASREAWVDNGGVIDETYYNAHTLVIDQRLALAGARLAALLEDAFGGNGGGSGGGGRGISHTARAKRNVRLRRGPSTAQTALETIHKGDVVTLLATSETNGFLHVKAADGKEGWVYGNYVNVH